MIEKDYTLPMILFKLQSEKFSKKSNILEKKTKLNFSAMILMSFYDAVNARFLETNEVLSVVNPSLASFSQINALLITKLLVTKIFIHSK